MDNMLQIKLLQEDTRNLYVPTGIERLAIDAKAHIRYAKQFGEDPQLPIYVNEETGMIKYVCFYQSFEVISIEIFFFAFALNEIVPTAPLRG